ncbi:MAG: sulfotransferase domain-containing protein [Pseudomonadota bacterium]|jgi:aryl sulfotransferase|nr:sulfotransferase [Alphaproteobacteria bacterium]
MNLPMNARPVRKYIYNSMMTDSRRWDGFKPRDGDIIISTPPKCGTTWTQMICALLIFQKTRFERMLRDYSPWLDAPLKDVDEVLGALEAQDHQRFIKTHTPLDGLPWFDNVIYLFVARDPRDAFVSLGNNMQNMTADVMQKMAANARTRSVSLQPPKTDGQDAFREWMNPDGGDGKPADNGAAPEADILHHARTFWEFRDLPNVHLLHYADMKANLETQMRRVAKAIGVTVDEAKWPELVAAAGFEAMKENADALVPGPGHPDPWVDNAGFFNKGAHGQWEGVLGEKELALYQKAMAARVPPDLARWLERGWNG